MRVRGLGPQGAAPLLPGKPRKGSGTGGSRGWRWSAAVGVLSVALAGPAFAESAFLLAYPARTGSVPASAYADDGKPFGRARLAMEQLAEGWLRIAFEAGRPDGAHIKAAALLEPVEPGKTLRLARQRSESFDESGRSVGLLEVDHESKRASCRNADGTLRDRIDLGSHDRIVNVPLNLLFMPLVRGDQKKLEFQIFLCREEARVVDFEAWTENGGPGRVEVRYGPDLGPFVSTMAQHFAPRLAFWFQRSAPYDWQANRLPLYSGGPEITVVRQGLGVDALD